MEPISARKERQREALVGAAEKAIAAEGLSGLKARDLAREIGVALGAIYNLVSDLDELYLRVASRTLARLDKALTQAATEAAPSDREAATQRLTAIAQAYRRFASENRHLWRSLFEHRAAAGKPFPEWAIEDQRKLFRHILQPLGVLTPGWEEAARMRLAKTLFSAVHGMIALGLDEKFAGVPAQALDAQIEFLLKAFCAGLAQVHLEQIASDTMRA